MEQLESSSSKEVSKRKKKTTTYQENITVLYNKVLQLKTEVKERVHWQLLNKSNNRRQRGTKIITRSAVQSVLIKNADRRLGKKRYLFTFASYLDSVFKLVQGRDTTSY